MSGSTPAGISTGQYVIVANDTLESIADAVDGLSAITFHADSTNTGTIWIGGEEGADGDPLTDANGFPLKPNGTLEMEIYNSSKLRVYGTLGDVLYWIATKIEN